MTRVKFVGHEWKGDRTKPVPGKEAEYNVTPDELKGAGGIGCPDLDPLKDALQAPAWVAQWLGPFVISPVGA